jgi:hypothetical protein
MNVATKMFASIPYTKTLIPTAVDFDFLEERIFWADVFLEEINSIFINGSGKKNILKAQGKYVFYVFMIIPF